MMYAKTAKQSFRFLLLLAFNNLFAYGECPSCDCCKDRQCRYNGFCSRGCIDGYFSSDCTHKCHKNCKTCTQIDRCDKCRDGYYNQYTNGQWYLLCEFRCPSSCVSCKSWNECNKCVDGLYNKIYTNCREHCNPVCKSCVNPKLCTECHSGKFGYECEFACGNGCQTNSCDLYGRCMCKPNFTGERCESCELGKYGPNCDVQCPQGCDICYMNGTCKSCNLGFTGNECSECSVGYYGGKCEKCPIGCAKKRCKNNGHCLSCRPGFNGSTCSSCENGKFGTNCTDFCSKGCLGDYCKKDGSCQCKTGFNGDQCRYCVTGKYGIFCNISCPTGCGVLGCKLKGQCYTCKNGFNGTMCDKCKVGKYGLNCTKTCSPGCAKGACERDGSCSVCRDTFKGKKCDQCADGNFGNYCTQHCRKTCSSCTSLTTCTLCKRGHWGNICKSCPINCLNCSSDSDCLSCENGFYGPICSNRCSSNCLGNICEKKSGVCFKGCIDGYYGNTCNENCSSTCNNSKCSKLLGECLEGCQPGYTGEKCNLDLSQAAIPKSDLVVTIGAGVGGGLFALIAVAVIVIIIIVKRRRRENKLDDNVKNEPETITSSEINNTNVMDENKHSGCIVTGTESMAYNVITDTDLWAKKNQEPDAIYTKPIKPKRKSVAVTVNSSNDKEPEIKNENEIKKTNRNTQAIASKYAHMDDKSTTRKSISNLPINNQFYNNNDAALEIEEDIERLTSKTKSVILEENAQKATELDSVDTYYNVGAVKKRKVRLDQLLEFVSKRTESDFANEFQTLPAMLIKPYIESQKRENLSKNRYKGIYPYDDTRVVLKDGDSDYINASYIDGYNKNRAYIASTGPTTKYMGDMSAFWIMVWQEKVEKIVMLTHLIEGGVPKCDKYWPEKDYSLTFANIQVTCLNEEEYSDYTFRTFSVQKDTVKRKIYHLHFTAWPDKGTPDDVTSLIEFRQKVNSTKTQLDGPVIVHCSAGIGRTGTYIALDSISKEGKAEGEVDIFAFVRNMREQRVHMIQTVEQYRYLHNTIVHTLTFDSEAIVAFKFSEYMKSHTEDHLGKMFEKLQASVEQRSDDEKEAVERNTALKNKNREGADIPGDRNRPKLYIARKLGSLDYINSVYVNSFKNMNRFLIAQTPLPETVEDFLALIVQEKVSCVISMETSSSNDMNVSIYCPADNHPLKKGAFTVKAERGKGTDQFMLRKMKISYSSNSGSEEVTVPHVQFTQWEKSSITPENPGKFVQFINEMELKLYGNDTKRPILVHCSTGATRSGLFCVVSTLLEKTQIDQEVSVVNTVRQITYRRHMAIPNKDQYIFCHQCVNEYLRTFELYSNFEVRS